MKEIGKDELKKIQLEILEYVDEFCNSHQINYFLTGGTLIGAIRHKGYIPWDDDIDICMLREDYNKFIDLFSKESNAPYIVCTHLLTKNYVLPYAKVVNSDTILKEKIMFSCTIGINIDVFPLDTIPENNILQRKMYSKFSIYYGMLQLKQILWSSERSCLKNLVVVIARTILKIVPYAYIVKKLHNNAIMYEQMESSLCGDVVWGYGIREITKREFFESTLKTEFECRLFPIPVGYDAFLKGLYGNYMQLPPQEKRVSHHAFSAFWK